MERKSPSRFPLFVDLNGKRAVIIGGGAVAARRAGVLARFGAEVTVIAPELKGGFEGAAVERRAYEPGDLEGAFLAAACTDDRGVNRRVGEEARALGIPVSVCDCPGECTFFFPAVCEGGGMVAGLVSQGGRDHAKTAETAGRVRRILEE